MWKNRLKPYDLLSGEEVEAIHGQAMTILEEIGVDFLHERAREIFSKAGTPVDGNRVRLDREMVAELVAKTPATFELQARNPARTVVLGGDGGGRGGPQGFEEARARGERAREEPIGGGGAARDRSQVGGAGQAARQATRRRPRAYHWPEVWPDR